MDTIGARIKAARAGGGWTQREIASRMGLSDEFGYLQISSWENGHKRPDVGNLGGLARALGVSADYLLGMEGGRGERP